MDFKNLNLHTKTSVVDPDPYPDSVVSLDLYLDPDSQAGSRFKRAK
jgi:hypothetical protein